MAASLPHGDGIDELFGNLSLSSALLHADHALVPPGSAPVGPDMSLSTTFRHLVYEGEHPTHGVDLDLQNPEYHVYSRYSTPVVSRVETVLSQIMNGHALTYRSGLAAAYAAVLHFSPKRLAIRKGYHGVHEILRIWKRTLPSFELIDIDDELREGDLLWVESPLNPTGEARNLAFYAEKAHKAGVKLVVDSTFAPPPLTDPFAYGADVVLHSGSKYLGGHSDLLAGVLVVKTSEEWKELWEDRIFLGSMLGSLEAYLLLRSIRTLKVRVLAQSSTATALAQWLHNVSKTPSGQDFDGVPGGVIRGVTHASLQTEEWVKEQLPGGYNPCFSITTTEARYAKALPFELQLFTAATSLGGVESLIEQRYMSDKGEDPTLLRLSVGLEDIEDLKADFRRALKVILKSTTGAGSKTENRA